MSGDDTNGGMLYRARMHRHGAIRLAVPGEDITSWLVVVSRCHGGLRKGESTVETRGWMVAGNHVLRHRASLFTLCEGQLLPRGRQVFAQPFLASSVAAGDHEPSYRYSSARESCSGSW